MKISTKEEQEKLTRVRNIVAFCALMENGRGVISKSPDYILEKFQRFALSTRDETTWGLDGMRKLVVSKWLKTWYGIDTATAKLKTTVELKNK